MAKVKICGLTGMEDIHLINRFQPDYAGFVFADSRRRITPYLAREMIRVLSPSVKKVGVFVNEPAETVNEISELCDLDIVQLHGEETPYYCTLINRPIWKAVRMKNIDSLKEADDYPVAGILLDTFSKNTYGGTGKTFDWNMITTTKHKIILAGGLSDANAAKAISRVRPYCVDVSSSVETDGVKDGVKIKAFIDIVRMGEKMYG